jgi:sterol desaturase/sphingolipid hydroxylase (fatty acid hydroxylase superfamily)
MENQIEINHSDVPIRLFQSDFLEFFTHVHPVVVLVIWLPYAVVMFDWGITLRPPQAGTAYLLGCFLAGLFVWSFVEYNIHRFFFHFCPTNAWQERIVYLFHGVHHAQPGLKTRLVMPPVVSIPMAAFFFALFYLLVGQALGQPHWVGPLTAGFTVGYVAYDMIHYATHHFPMRWGVFRYLKRHHMLHHYKTPDKRFGVSSPLWDWVYGTLPKD